MNAHDPPGRPRIIVSWGKTPHHAGVHFHQNDGEHILHHFGGALNGLPEGRKAESFIMKARHEKL